MKPQIKWEITHYPNHNNFIKENKMTKRTKMWETTNQMRDNTSLKQETHMMRRECNRLKSLKKHKVEYLLQ